MQLIFPFLNLLIILVLILPAYGPGLLSLLGGDLLTFLPILRLGLLINLLLPKHLVHVFLPLL